MVKVEQGLKCRVGNQRLLVRDDGFVDSWGFAGFDSEACQMLTDGRQPLGHFLLSQDKNLARRLTSKEAILWPEVHIKGRPTLLRTTAAMASTKASKTSAIWSAEFSDCGGAGKPGGNRSL